MTVTDETTDTDEPAVACTLSEDRREERVEADREAFYDYYEGAEELPNGYRFSFEGSAEALSAVAGFVGREAECCAFADFTIEYERPHGEVGLRFTGSEGTTDLLAEGFAEVLEGFPPE